MSIITLTTDLGLKDFYVPAVKGYILNRVPSVNLVDIAHQIQPFNIGEAAFVLRHIYQDFPANTIHLISVESDIDIGSSFILAMINNQYFLAKDNGLITLITDEPFQKIYQLPVADKQDLKFPLKYIMASTACQLQEGAEIKDFANETTQVQTRMNLRAILMEDIIRGTIIHIDNFGNVITNITYENFERYQGKKQEKLNYSKNEYINKISEHYEDVPEGERVALFGTTGLLEVAINKGNAAKLLGLEIGQIIILEFE